MGFLAVKTAGFGLICTIVGKGWLPYGRHTVSIQTMVPFHFFFLSQGQILCEVSLVKALEPSKIAPPLFLENLLWPLGWVLVVILVTICVLRGPWGPA